MENKDLLKPEEDLFQKSLHQEADFYKGMFKHGYGSLWSFSFGYLMTLIFIFTGLLVLGILFSGVSNAIQDNALFYSSFILGVIILALASIFCFFLGFKILKRLIFIFKKRSKEFRIKAVILLFIPTLLLILIIALIYQSLSSINFIY